MQSHKFKIGTRGSPLALWQAGHVRDLLAGAGGFAPEDIGIEIIQTSGDMIQDKALREFGGKGLFTKEIEDALLSGKVDLAVHSMKDVQTVLPDGLIIPCILQREDIRDAFISHKAATLAELPQGAVIGTSSLRRGAQVRRIRPDLKVVTYRGNVETRLKKLRDGVVDATFLAAAGLRRLGYEADITSYVETSDMLPAIAQGAIGIEVRADDMAIQDLLKPLNHEPTAIAITAERAFLKALDGSCRTPIAALARLNENRLDFEGMILKPDGSEFHEITRSGTPAEAIKLGQEAGLELLERGGPNFLHTQPDTERRKEGRDS